MSVHSNSMIDMVGYPDGNAPDQQGTRQNLPSKVLPFVMFSLASLTCSATPGKTAAREEKPIAGLPGPNDKVEGVLPRVLPSGRTLLPVALRFCRVPCRQQGSTGSLLQGGLSAKLPHSRSSRH